MIPVADRIEKWRKSALFHTIAAISDQDIKVPYDGARMTSMDGQARHKLNW